MMERLTRRLARPDLRLDGRAGWLLPAILAADAIVATWGMDVPNGSGVRYWIVWLAVSALALGGAALLRRRLRPAGPPFRPVECLAIMALAAMVLSDATMAWQPLRDLGIYLKAGHHFLDGAPVYMQTPLTVQPEDRTGYPFLYPPCTLPIFGALAMLPVPVAQAVWVAGSLSLGLLALRWFGLPRRWLVGAILWPPFFEGLWVGNVALPGLALFAVGPWLGAGLVLGAIFKSYTGLAALWLIRERRWVQAAAGIGAVALVVAVTLPLTGIGAWSDWLDGLGVYQTSQRLVPGLYGFGLMRFVPFAAYAVLAVAAALAALRARGLESLARLGTATVVAGPSLFGHGLLMAVPSLLSLRTAWLWLAAGFLSLPDGWQWWPAVAVITASWAAPSMRREKAEGSAPFEPLHPLGAGRPWPGVQEAWPAEVR
jgi:hypothetical protein